MVTIVRKSYGVQEADTEISNVTKMLELWDIEYSYSVEEAEKDMFVITFILCDQKKSAPC